MKLLASEEPQEWPNSPLEEGRGSLVPQPKKREKKKLIDYVTKKVMIIACPY